MRIVLELVGAAIHRPAAVAVLQEDLASRRAISSATR